MEEELSQLQRLEGDPNIIRFFFFFMLLEKQAERRNSFR
jgi:hypothetical protein